MSDDENFTPIKSVPSHTSPPTDGITYAQVDRQWYRVRVGEYTGTQLRRYAYPSIPVDRELWHIVPGESDHKVSEDDRVTFRNSGMRFFTTPRFVNGG